MSPSTRPSRLSQAARAPAWSTGRSAALMISVPSAAMLARVFQPSENTTSGIVMLAGAPAMIPSKSVGYRWASTRAWRPPLEQELK